MRLHHVMSGWTGGTPHPARSTEESGPRAAKLFAGPGWRFWHSSSLPSTSRLAQCRVDWADDLTAITAAGQVSTPTASSVGSLINTR